MLSTRSHLIFRIQRVGGNHKRIHSFLLKMDILFLVLSLLFVNCVSAQNSACSKDIPTSFIPGCSQIDVPNASVCYESHGNNLTARISCLNGTFSLHGENTYSCIRGNSDWTSPINSTCISQVSTTPTKTTTTVATPSATKASSSPSLSSTLESTKVSPEETAASGSTAMKSDPPTTAQPQSSTGTSGTTISAITSTQTKGQTKAQDNTIVTTQDSDSVVVPVVSAFVVVVIALAAVVIFLLWRHRRLKQQKAVRGFSGTSISNRGYEDDHGLDRHISLLDMRYDDSNDSGYAEISPGKLNVEEGPDNEYQTIKDLPEDKMEGNSGYGHLKMQTTTFIDNNYSHVAVNQNGKQSSDVTYSHTGNPLNAQELKDDEETTYNHLEQNARKIQGTQQPLKNEEREVVGDVDAEYNHAKAGHLALEPDNKGDTYSHLNNTLNSRRIQQDDLKFLTHGSKTETYRTKTMKLDSDKGDGKNTFPEYAKCAKKVNDRETPKQVGRDGYETPSGAANIYFTLEPESKLADRDVSFQVTNETFEDSDGEESPNHQYFILEKTDTNT